MCLAVPGQIISREGDDAVVDFHGSRVHASLMLTPDADVGGWVLVHAGFAISSLAEDEARQTWEYLKEAEIVDEIAPALAANDDAPPEGGRT